MTYDIKYTLHISNSLNIEINGSVNVTDFDINFELIENYKKQINQNKNYQI